jgi:FtsP/CotA-like multicopper oxidase with cupredoxin domain
MVRAIVRPALAASLVMATALSCADDGTGAPATSASAVATSAAADAATTTGSSAAITVTTSESSAGTVTPSASSASTVTTTSPPPPPGPDLVEPSVIDSSKGVLATTLDAKVARLDVGGREVETLVYNDSYPAPTLRMRAGDDLRVKLINNSDGDTNLHTHGFHVSPVGSGDNVLHHLMPGGTWDLAIDTPDDLSPGFYWYHAHNHGDTESQVTGGLAGAIVVEGPLGAVTGVAGRSEHVLMIQASQFDEDGQMVPVADQTTNSVTRFVNGQLNPVIRMRPGEVQRWRIANIQANDFMELSLDDHQLHQIAADANPFDEVVAQDSIVMAPANRVEVLVEAGQPGTYVLRAGSFAGSAAAVLATLEVAGEPVKAEPLPTELLPFDDLRDDPVDATRTVTFSNHNKTGWAVIDGKAFDADRVDQTIQLGALEEWTIRNDSDDWHPFHIHVNDFQVVAIGDAPYDAHSLLDTVPLPPNSSVTFRIRFADFTGKAVYHCHILNHEDLGMMAVFEVVSAPG